MTFDAASIRVADIRKEASYGGPRMTFSGGLDGARCALQVDAGYGDAVTPAPELVRFPVLLDDLPQPFLRAYPVVTLIAVKYHAMVSLGMTNTRLKDYFDLWIRVNHADIDRAVLANAMAATFAQRNMVPRTLPLGLLVVFASDPVKP